jgi:DNA-binding NtrC family response regulator
MSGSIVVVDDDEDMRESVAAALRAVGYAVEEAVDGEDALALLTRIEPDVVVTDLEMPRRGGVELVREGARRFPDTTFIVMSAFGTLTAAVDAVKAGAEQFLTKPVDLAALRALVERGVARTAQRREVTELRGQLGRRRALSRIVGEHPSIRRMLAMVAKVAPSRANVLIVGESGTGKELIASAIHAQSPRAGGPFVELNCAALAETLLESELFGHEKGAFTGAVRRRDGRFAQADGGTLFLDEVSEIPLPLQVKLLRFLQERQFQRVGGDETLTVDTRVVAATNRPLRPLVADGHFREDLFYRLDVVEIEVPPLRARSSDIPLLADHFLRRFAADNGVEILGFTAAALAGLSAHTWPGNVRELENTIERAVVMCDGDRIDAAHLGSLAEHAAVDPLTALVGIPMQEVERMLIERTLAAVDGSTARAAEMLGISQRTIQSRLRQWEDGSSGSE